MLLSSTWYDYEFHNVLTAHDFNPEEQVDFYNQAFVPSMTSYSFKEFGRQVAGLIKFCFLVYMYTSISNHSL